MFNHLLILKLNNISDLEFLKSKFFELKDNISKITEIQIKENCYKQRETNYDLYVNFVFDNEKDFESYLVDKYHVEFVDKFINKLVKEKVAIDIEN